MATQSQIENARVVVTALANKPNKTKKEVAAYDRALAVLAEEPKATKTTKSPGIKYL